MSGTNPSQCSVHKALDFALPGATPATLLILHFAFCIQYFAFGFSKAPAQLAVRKRQNVERKREPWHAAYQRTECKMQSAKCKMARDKRAVGWRHVRSGCHRG
jgi:hypothetical protein